MHLLHTLTVLMSLAAASKPQPKRQISRSVTFITDPSVTFSMPSVTISIPSVTISLPGVTIGVRGEISPSSTPSSIISSSQSTSATTSLSTPKSSSTSSTLVTSSLSNSKSSTSSLPASSSSNPTAALSTAKASATITVGTRYQTVEGFGFSEAFGGASSLQYVSSSTQQKIFEYLFSSTTGAGMTIIRNGIGSSAANVSNMLSILRQPPTVNGTISPNGTANYTWDGSDNGQVTFVKGAQAYGNITIIADAWSAPPFMKTNDDEIHGGYICGVTGTDCATGDWRQAYANYLVQYIKFYAEEGIPIKYIGFVNEPDLNEPYPSMGTSGAQAADFINVLYPTIKAANLTTGISCCDGSGWYAESILTSGLAAVANQLAIRAAHPYSTPATFSLTTLQPTWQTEWSNQKGANYTTEWYSGENNPGEGLIWATNIYTGLTSGNCSAYLYWQGAQFGEYVNTALLSINFDGTLTVPKRFWAFAQYSRGVRPGAVRVAATSSTTNVKVTAFENLDGSLAIQAINSAASNYNMSLSLKGLTGKTITSWLTDNNNNFTTWNGTLASSGTGLTGSVPPYSLVSFIIS